MTMKLELNPEAEAGLLAQAQARGLSLEDFVKQVLEERGIGGRHAARLSAEERLHAFEEFMAGFESPAVVPDEALSRENLYPDRW
jgi:hypothetical protein